MSNQQKLKKTTILVFTLTIFIALISCNNEAAKPPEQIIVSYDANGGNSKKITTSQILEEGKELNIANYWGSKDDKPFLFWNTDKDGNGKIFTPGLLYTEKKSVKLYAEFGDLLTPDIAENLTVTAGSLNITVDNNYKIIWNNAFSQYNNIAAVSKIKIPESIKLIGAYSFTNFTNLETLVLNEKLQIILANAFSACSSLNTVTIPKYVHSLALTAFSNCTNLVTIEVDKDNTYYSSQDGVVYNKDKTELVIHPIANDNYTFPETVTRIGNNAFNSNTMTEITIPNSITNIESGAFTNCKALAAVTILSNIKVIKGWTLAYCTNLTTITYNGTIADWNKIQLMLNWNAGCKEITVTCTKEIGENKNITIPAWTLTP